MLDDVLAYLACPYCGAGLARAGSALHCARGHAFNVARQGYASLLPKKAGGEGGDTAAMVQARADFLGAGHFAELAAVVAAAAAEAIAAAAADGARAGCVLDSGAGTGYYLARVLDELPGRAGVALDRSRYALRRAARAHERVGAVACDVWRRLPVATAAAVLALDVFAPRNGAELRRILDPAGRLVVVTPQDDHLRELAAALGLLGIDERKQERLAGKLGRVLRAGGPARVPGRDPARPGRRAGRRPDGTGRPAHRPGGPGRRGAEPARAGDGHGVGARVGLPALALTRVGSMMSSPGLDASGLTIDSRLGSLAW